MVANGTVRRIGYLAFGSAGSPVAQAYVAALRQGLSEFGYAEPGNLKIETGMVSGDADQFPKVIDELLTERRVEVIVVGDNRAMDAVRDRWKTVDRIPVVTAVSFDPVHFEMADHPDRPGRKITGVTISAQGLNWARMELLTRVVPKARSVAILGIPDDYCSTVEDGEAQGAAKALGLEPRTVTVTDPLQFAQVLKSVDADLLFVLRSSLAVFSRERLVIAVAGAQLPAMYPFKEFVQAGGLISYGPDRIALMRRAATYVARILDGGDPSLMPMEAPREFDLAVNLTTAKSLKPHSGLEVKIPQHLTDRATLVIP